MTVMTRGTHMVVVFHMCHVVYDGIPDCLNPTVDRQHSLEFDSLRQVDSFYVF